MNKLYLWETIIEKSKDLEVELLKNRELTEALLKDANAVYQPIGKHGFSVEWSSVKNIMSLMKQVDRTHQNILQSEIKELVSRLDSRRAVNDAKSPNN